MEIKLVEAIKEHKYGGQIRKVGDRYEAPLAHLPFILTKARWVKIVEPTPAKPAPAPDPAKPPEKPARNYKRRDLEAEK